MNKEIDVIDRDKLAEYWRGKTNGNDQDLVEWDYACGEFVESCFSSTLIKLREGRWLVRGVTMTVDGENVSLECSQCGYEHDLFTSNFTLPFSYCPRCGSKNIGKWEEYWK